MLPRSLVLRAGAVSAALALTLAGTLAPTAATETATEAAKHRDPRHSRGLYVDPGMPAHQQGGVYRERIGRVPQAFWVLPEAYGTASVRATVAAYTDAAAAARRTPVLTVYGIPGRDCGSYSSQHPLTGAAQYRAWIKQVAAGLRGSGGASPGGSKALVVLEPDALALFSSSDEACPTKPAGWQRMLRSATRTLARTGAWVYLDAGHSRWTPYDTRPRHLKAAGVRFARGISTNVSNFRPTADEKRYAARLLRGLRKLGITGKHYVVDTSRNGARPSPDAYDVINPPGARLGKRPRLVLRGAFDGTLWVKHPGESDGYEHGGPAAGQWCDFLADRLLDIQPESGGC